MRKQIALLMILILVLSAPVVAFAEEGSAAERGLAAIRQTGCADSVVLPKEESYLGEWKTLYARKAFRAPCLEVQSAPVLHKGYLPTAYLYEGVECTVVAEENDMSCILYRGINHKQYVGWIQSIRLLEDFPGESYTVGSAPEKPATFRDDITLKNMTEGWRTKDQFIFRPYTQLSEEVKDCVGFTYEYQLIEENTYHWDNIYGPREIYVRSGGEWIKVGEFPYPEKGAVKVQVWLDQPMNFDAIGCVALCKTPNQFGFRQTATDFASAA